MLKKSGFSAEISSDPMIISNADKLILPGVGSFDYGMRKLKELGLISVLNKCVIDNSVSILGICLGIQLFCNTSEEGVESGLGWINADVVKFNSERMESFQKIPHMGWAETQSHNENKLICLDEVIPRYYYVHSYHLDCHDRSLVLSTAKYGYEFVSAIQSGNIIGVQFHPEKSHRFGMALLKNFIEKY